MLKEMLLSVEQFVFGSTAAVLEENIMLLNPNKIQSILLLRATIVNHWFQERLLKTSRNRI
ncbi:MAG TPA: hypothetical protein VHA52_07140 [Candidatus Babeliaceae bacterium]|nr:hypothetical protein [Candidatus Babeliaceae bacterium]